MPLELLLLTRWVKTVAVETAVALIWGLRKPSELGILALINTVTNLTLNLILMVLNLYVPHQTVSVLLIAMEAAVFLAEGFMIRGLIRQCRHPFLLSLTMNAASFLFGYFIRF